MKRIKNEYDIDVDSLIEGCVTYEDLINKVEIAKNKDIANHLCDYLIDICYENGIVYTPEEEKEIVERIEKNKLELLELQIKNPVVNIIMLNDSGNITDHSLKRDFGLKFSQYGDFSGDMTIYMNRLYNYEGLKSEIKKELLLMKYRRIRYFYSHTYYNNEEIPNYIYNNKFENNNENTEQSTLKFINKDLNEQQKKYNDYVKFEEYLNYKYPNQSESYMKLYESIFRIESEEDRDNIYTIICNYHQNVDINTYSNKILEKIANNYDKEYFYCLKGVKNENLKYLKEYKSEVDCDLNNQVKLISSLKNYNINIYRMKDILLFDLTKFDKYYNCFKGMNNDECNEIMNNIDTISQNNTNVLYQYNIKDILTGKTREYKRFYYKELQRISKESYFKNIIEMLKLTENDNYLKCLLYGCYNIENVQKKTEVKCVLNSFIQLDSSSLFFIKILSIMTDVEYNNLVRDFINLYVIRKDDIEFNDECELLKDKKCKYVHNNVVMNIIKSIISIVKPIDKKYTVLIIELLKDFVVSNEIKEKLHLHCYDSIVINNKTNELIKKFENIFKKCGNLNIIIDEIEVLGKDKTLELYSLCENDKNRNEINLNIMNYYYNQELKSVIANIYDIQYIKHNFSNEEKNLYNIILDSNINDGNRDEIKSTLNQLKYSGGDIGKCLSILRKYGYEICSEVNDLFFTIDNNILNEIIDIDNIKLIDNIKELYNQLIVNEKKEKELVLDILKCIFDNTNYISKNNICILCEKLSNCNDNDFTKTINIAMKKNKSANEKKKKINEFIENNKIENFKYFEEYLDLKSKKYTENESVKNFVKTQNIDSFRIDEGLEKAKTSYENYDFVYAKCLIYEKLFNKYDISDLAKLVKYLNKEINEIQTDIEIDPYSVKILEKLNDKRIMKIENLVIVKEILNSFFTLLQNHLNNLFQNDYLKIDIENYVKENVIRNIKNINKYILQENMNEVFNEYNKYYTKKIELNNIRKRNILDSFENSYNFIPTIVESVKESTKLATKERSSIYIYI